jgi:hypothetical protein
MQVRILSTSRDFVFFSFIKFQVPTSLLSCSKCLISTNERMSIDKFGIRISLLSYKKSKLTMKGMVNIIDVLYTYV